MWLVSYFRLPILCFSCFRTVLRGESNPSAEGFGYAMDYKANQMTQAQKDTVLYYIGAGEYDKASQYLADIERELNERANSGFQETMTQWAQEHPVQGALTNMFSWPLSIPATVDNLGEAVRQKVTGEYAPADVNRDAYLGARIGTGTSQGVQEAARQAATDTFGSETAGDVAAFLTGTGLSIGQNITQVPLGALTLPAMAAQAGGSAAQDAYQNGATLEQAATYGTASGALEAGTEMLFGGLAGLGRGVLDSSVGSVVNQAINRLGGTKAGQVMSGLAQNSLVRALADSAGEGVEEVISTALSPYLERAIYDPDAENATAEELIQSALLGAAAGGVFQGLGAIARRAGVNAGDNSPRETATMRREDRGMLVPRLRTATESTTDTSPTQDTQRATMPQTASEGRNNTASTGETGSTAVNTDPKVHTAREQAVISEYQNATDEALKETFESYLSNPSQGFSRHNISNVSDKQSSDASRLLGGNYNGYKNAINSNGIIHILNEHGPSGATDHSFADLNDASRIGYVLDNYDNVEIAEYESGDIDYSREFRTKDNRPAPMLKYSKKVNGTYFVVEAIPESRYKKFWVVSAYMQTADGGTQAPNANGPRNTPNASLASSPSAAMSSIPPVVRDVNGRLQFGIMLPKVEGADVAVGETGSYDAAEDTGPLPIRLPEEPLDSGKDMTYNNSGRAALAEDEYAALLDYKSSGSYKLNAAIRDGRLDPAQEQAVAAMDRALAAMPVYRGRVYRRMSFDLSGPETLAAFLAEHEAGSIIVYPAYTSTSTSPDGYPVNGNLTVTLVIDGHSGRNIDGFGNNFESEILFPRESSFYIERMETDDQGKPVIYMREVAENGEGIQPGGTGGAAGRDYRGQQGESPQERSQTVQQMQETVRNDMQDLSQWNPKEDFDRQRLSGLRAEGKRSRAVTPEDSTGAAPYGFDPYSNMLNEYGAIPEGENPARVVDVPVSTNGNDRVSRTARTVMEAQATPENMLGDIAQAIADGELSHDVVADKAATARARRTVENKGWEGALEEFHQAARSGRLSKNNVALGQVLLNNAMNAGDSQMAIDLLVDYASLATAAGQTLQAQRMLKKLTPEGQLYGIQRSVSNIQEELQQKYRDKAPDLEIPEELIEKFRNATDQDGRDAAAEEIYKNIASQVPSTWMDKWNAWRYMAMLTNPRTHIRNIVGNAGFVPVRMIKDAIATTLEAGADLILPGGIQRTKAPLNLLSKTDRDLVRASFSDVNNVQNQLLGSGKYADSASGKIEDYRTIFKFKPLEGVRKGNSNLMEVEDSWFSKTAYAGALAGYLKANGVTARQFSDGTVSQETLDVGREYAIQEAQKANAVCEKLSPGT